MFYLLIFKYVAVSKYDVLIESENPWENSGLFEGDIMIYKKSERNGIVNSSSIWPNATIPFIIDRQFSMCCVYCLLVLQKCLEIILYFF